MHLDVSFVRIHLCLCARMHTETRGWHQVTFSAALHLVVWEEGVSHWTWSSLISPILALELQKHAVTPEFNTRVLRIRTQALVLTWQVFYWLVHLYSLAIHDVFSLKWLKRASYLPGNKWCSVLDLLLGSIGTLQPPSLQNPLARIYNLLLLLQISTSPPFS